MKLTFNILNQVYGSDKSFSQFIQALRDIGVKQSPHRIEGFVTWDVTPKQIETIVAFFNSFDPPVLWDYDTIIYQIVSMSQAANPIELERHNDDISGLEDIECYIKSPVNLMEEESPFIYSDIDEESGIETILNYTWGEWMGGNVRPLSDSDGFSYMPIIPKARYIDMDEYKTVFEWCQSEGYKVVSLVDVANRPIDGSEII